MTPRAIVWVSYHKLMIDNFRLMLSPSLSGTVSLLSFETKSDENKLNNHCPVILMRFYKII